MRREKRRASLNNIQNMNTQNQQNGAALAPVGGSAPVSGQLYECNMNDGQTRILRYGYHRKNNDKNWSDPPANTWGKQPNGDILAGPSFLWYGWRDHHTGRFRRPEHVKSFRLLPILR